MVERNAWFWGTHAHADLKLERLFVVYPGTGGTYPMWDWIEVAPIAALEKRVRELVRK